MARARNIKPSFFTNEELVELPFETRLLFIGLWTLADRAGRLEDRPKRIKMAIFPADDVNVDDALQQLSYSQFIHRYEVNGERYIEVVNFSKHQNPHIKEAPSRIPASTVQARCENGASHADSLIPDSNPLNPPLAPAGARGTFPSAKAEQEKPKNGAKINLDTPDAIAKAFSHYLGKPPPAGKDLSECRSIFWRQFKALKQEAHH